MVDATLDWVTSVGQSKCALRLRPGGSARVPLRGQSEWAGAWIRTSNCTGYVCAGRANRKGLPPLLHVDGLPLRRQSEYQPGVPRADPVRVTSARAERIVADLHEQGSFAISLSNIEERVTPVSVRCPNSDAKAYASTSQEVLRALLSSNPFTYGILRHHYIWPF